jgi:hypothetical protein
MDRADWAFVADATLFRAEELTTGPTALPPRSYVPAVATALPQGGSRFRYPSKLAANQKISDRTAGLSNDIRRLRHYA